jgi:hypothetical protein
MSQEETIVTSDTDDTGAGGESTSGGAKNPEGGTETIVQPPAGEKTEKTGSESEGTPTPKAPEKYELSAPDGSLLAGDALEQISTLARELDLTNEQALRLVEREGGALQAYQESALADLKQATMEWLEEIKSDPELGGEHLAETKALSQTVLDRFGDDTLKQELVDTGYCNHPGLVRLLVKIGRAMKAEDTIVATGQGKPAAKSAEGKLYPGQEG